MQDKGARFVVLDHKDYVEKIEYQLGRSSFEELDHDPSKLFAEKVNLWIQKRTGNKVLDKSWSKFTEPSFVALGKMYGLVKTQINRYPRKSHHQWVRNSCGEFINMC